MKANKSKIVLLILMAGFILLAISSNAVSRFSTFGVKNLYDVMLQENEEFKVDEISIKVWYGNLTIKEYKLEKKENVERVIELFQELKVKQDLLEDISNSWGELGIYNITMKDNVQDKYSTISIKDGEHLELNGKQYKISNDVDWESFYYLVVSEYEGEYKEYYTNYPELLKEEKQNKDENGEWYQ